MRELRLNSFLMPFFSRVFLIFEAIPSPVDLLGENMEVLVPFSIV
jgi:hypothetical protein